MIATIVTTMSGMTAKTVPIESTLANGTETTVSSAGIAVASRVITGIGAMATRIATSSLAS